jgi:NADH dehydrogenase
MDLVAGATGSLGGRVVRELLARGRPVRALVRDPAAVDTLEQLGVDVVVGNLTQPDTLADACEGIDAVVSTASASRRTDDSPENVDQRGTQNLIDAARAAGAERFVLVSTLAAAPDSPIPLFRAKGLAEAHLIASGLTYTILQADAFMDVWLGMLIGAPLAAGQPVTLVGDSRRRHSFVAEPDVAQFVVAVTRHPEARNTTIPIGGPEAITLREAVQAFEEASGRPIQIRSVPPGAPIPGLPEQVWPLAAWLESFDSPVPMEETCRRFGVTTTSVRDFARAWVGGG